MADSTNHAVAVGDGARERIGKAAGRVTLHASGTSVLEMG